MFVSSTKKAAGLWNGIILFAVVAVSVTTVLMLLKLKKDPKDSEAQRFTLGLKKK